MQNNSFRIRFLPTNQENFPRYKLFENSIIINQEIINKLTSIIENIFVHHILKSDDCKAEIYQSPFYIAITDKFNSKIYINYNQKLIFEHIGEKVPPDYWPYYMNDTIKNGAISTGIDFSFPGTGTRLTGFSESDDRMNIEDTLEEPRRASNFDYYSEYGHIPLIYGHIPISAVLTGTRTHSSSLDGTKQDLFATRSSGSTATKTPSTARCTSATMRLFHSSEMQR